MIWIVGIFLFFGIVIAAVLVTWFAVDRMGFKESIQEGAERLRDRMPERETTESWVESVRGDPRKRAQLVVIALVLGLVLCCCCGGGYWLLNPPQNVATVGVGSYVTLTDNCGSSYNVQITLTHVEQTGVSVGTGDCRRWYPLTAGTSSSR